MTQKSYFSIGKTVTFAKWGTSYSRLEDVMNLIDVLIHVSIDRVSIDSATLVEMCRSR